MAYLSSSPFPPLRTPSLPVRFGKISGNAPKPSGLPPSSPGLGTKAAAASVSRLPSPSTGSLLGGSLGRWLTTGLKLAGAVLLPAGGYVYREPIAKAASHLIAGLPLPQLPQGAAAPSPAEQVVQTAKSVWSWTQKLAAAGVSLGALGLGVLALKSGNNGERPDGRRHGNLVLQLQALNDDNGQIPVNDRNRFASSSQSQKTRNKRASGFLNDVQIGENGKNVRELINLVNQGKLELLGITLQYKRNQAYDDEVKRTLKSNPHLEREEQYPESQARSIMWRNGFRMPEIIPVEANFVFDPGHSHPLIRDSNNGTLLFHAKGTENVPATLSWEWLEQQELLPLNFSKNEVEEDYDTTQVKTLRCELWRPS